ncbi:MAG: ATP-grasp domain-containing protein, partial [Coprobacillus sp.]
TYMEAAVGVTPDRPILIDRFLNNAMECEADAISDGTNVFVPAVMEHIELAGIHSGDSACILPSKHISMRHLDTIKEYTKKIAKEMNVRGLMNMQYAIADGKVYVLEANPRASRTVPLVSKVCNINMVKIATEIVTNELTGNESPVPGLTEKKVPHVGVKQAVFPFNMFPEVDPILGPEMRSTGEVLGIGASYGAALYKAEEGAKTILPTEGKVLFSVNDLDKPQLIDLARGYYDAGFTIVATGNTFELIKESGIPVEKIKKLREGRPNITDALTNGELALIINTPHGKQSADDDSYIRKSAIKMRTPYMTNIAAAKASLEGIMEMKIHGGHEVKSLQEYHKSIR